jgi:hypothetical protein
VPSGSVMKKNFDAGVVTIGHSGVTPAATSRRHAWTATGAFSQIRSARTKVASSASPGSLSLSHLRLPCQMGSPAGSLCI